VLIAVLLYFLVVAPADRLITRFRPHELEMNQRSCPECLSSIPAEARRCSYCTVMLPPGHKEDVASSDQS
jgi:large conductance mechanosensitive channel